MKNIFLCHRLTGLKLVWRLWVTETKLSESFMSLEVAVPMPLAFFIYRFLKRFFNFSFIDSFEGKSFTIRNIGSNDYLLNFYNAWMISVRIDNITNWLDTGIFKIYDKGFWFSTTAFFNNSYVITIKQFCQFFSSEIILLVWISVRRYFLWNLYL